jgi:hypothetical protein
MPTRSLQSRVAALGGALLLALASGPVQAHEPGADALPASTGWQAGAALALTLPQSDARWPTAAWPGVLGTGSAPRDQRRGVRLEHGTLDLAARVDARFGAHVAVGWHDRDRAHVEAAVVQGQFAWAGGDLDVRLGRDTVRMGGMIDGAGHFDRFSQAPLIKRAVFDDAWIDDGGAIAWRRPDADGVRALELGVWRGRAFPGGPDGPAAPTLHLHAGWGHVDAHLSAARAKPTARGSAALSLGSTGHVHGSLDCRASLAQRVCFDGTVDLLGGSVQWEPESADWTVALAGLIRRERGSLYGTSGDAALDSRVSGLWLDLAWRPVDRWTVAARAERLVSSHRVEGIGTALLAASAGIAGGGPVERLTVALQHQLNEPIVLSMEAGQERFAGGRVSHVALRVIWRSPRILGGSW